MFDWNLPSVPSLEVVSWDMGLFCFSSCIIGFFEGRGYYCSFCPTEQAQWKLGGARGPLLLLGTDTSFSLVVLLTRVERKSVANCATGF